jgi:predicted transcriptional regulator
MNKPVISHIIPPEDKATFRAGMRRGIADADAGRTVPFEKVKAWLMSWGKPDELPPPECE